MPPQIDSPTREAILRRVESQIDDGLHRPPETPLDWNDIGLLSHGMAMAVRPLLAATRKVTERNSLGPRGAWLLNLISGGVIYPHELSDVFGIGRSLMSSELARLSDAGLIKSTPGERDKRRTELALTDLGRSELGEIRCEIERILTVALKGYSPEEVRLCARMLRDLRENSPI